MRQNFRKLNTRVLALVLAAVLFLCHMPVVFAAETSGECGKNLSWSFADGTLTITGTGDMTDYNQRDMAPWYEYRDQIFYLSLPEGLTSVGSLAFYDCTSLMAITLPSTVTDIGSLAFCQNRNVTILNLNQGLTSIGRSAFEQMDKLQDLRLPDSLTTIGDHAFYCCRSLQFVTVPVAVTALGIGVFAYCEGLIGAEVASPLDTLPPWTFYGCGKLTSVALARQTAATDVNAFTGCEKLMTVYYSGTEENAQKLKDSISKDEEGFSQFGTISTDSPMQEGSTSSSTVGVDGEVIVNNTTVSVTDNATISITTSDVKADGGKTATVEVDATVVTPQGWDEVLDAIKEAQSILSNKSQTGTVDKQIEVNGYIAGVGEVPQAVLEQLSGRNVSLNVQMASGAKFTVEGSALDDKEVSGGLNMDYTLSRMLAGTYETLGGAGGYMLRFQTSSAVNTEVMIRLPIDCARKKATLYQLENDVPVLLQSVVADAEGYAHFYVAEINKDTQYLIGIDVPGIDADSVIVPEELYGEYGITDLAAPIEYVITGRTSSWGMSGWQVTAILVGVLVVCVVGVGVFMYAMNKRKLKMGYIPDVEDDDDED